MKLVIFFIFLGSVFFTSEKFVDTEIAAKYYFTILAVLSWLIVLVSKNKTVEINKLAQLSILKSFYTVGVLQAIYGVLQYVGRFSSHHNAFSVTGSFDNPAGFAAVLSLLFPIGLYWCIKAKKLEQQLVFFSLGLLVFVITLSSSRSGVLSILVSSTILLSLEFEFLRKVKLSRKVGLVSGIALIVFFCISYGMYRINSDSVNGRLLIWEVSSEMAKDKPLTGFGRKGFQANYMCYQADYFKAHPQSKHTQLADNVKHPFNEFIKITVNYGILGLILFLSLLVYVFIKLWHTKCTFRAILVSTFIALITLSCFSYPLQYAPVYFLLGFYLLLAFVKKIPRKLPLYTKGLVALLCLCGIAFTSINMYREIQWKSIAVKSLQGKTKQMLPRYKELYPKLKNNGFFLYNYGAELNIAKHYDESIAILEECEELFNDYDLQMLLADNYAKLDSINLALSTLQYAANMIPCRFLPLHKQLEIHKKHKDKDKAKEIANVIISKEVKVPSSTVSYIIYNAETYLENTYE